MAASIQTRVLALVGTGVFLAAGALSLLSRSSLLDLEQAVRQQHTRLAAALAGNVSDAVADDLQRLALAASAPHINLIDSTDAPEQLALAAIQPQGRLWSAVFFVRDDGTVGAAEPVDFLDAVDVDVIRHEVMPAIIEQRPLISNVVRDRAGGGWLVYVVPFRPSGGRPAGAAGAVVALSARGLNDLLRGPALGASIQARLLDGTGRIIASTAPASRDTKTPAAATAKVDGTPWTVSLTDVESDALAPIATFRRQSFWLAPSLAVLAMLLGWGIARSIRRPLVHLTESAERIAHGDLDRPVDGSDVIASGAEIARLAGALERMRVALQASVRDIEHANRDLERRVTERTRELGRLNTRLEERERLRKQLLRKVISAQEDERKRVARELHDETSQTLAAIGIGVDTMIAAPCDEASRGRLRDLRRLVDRMHQELHRLIVNLRPSVLDDLGLAAAIRWFAERHLGDAGISVRCEIGDLEVRLPTEVETAVFRVVQEAIVNISRHAQAESVLIQGGTDGQRLTIEIEDDGIGFDPARAVEGPESLRGVGLLGMRERIEILGGTLEIDSEPNGGTRVVMDVPAEVQAA